MNSSYNYYPNVGYDNFDYDFFVNSIGLNNNTNSNLNSSVNVENSNDGKIYGPYDGYIRGNMFKDLYSEYKNYKPASLTPRSERKNALLNLDQMHFAMHEANLYLDVYPNDANMMKNYVEFRNSYNKLLQEYQQKYGAINVNSDYLENVPFGWEEEIWPWNRRDS